MLTSINPLGERARNQSFGITATAYVAASTLAGAALGALLGALGAPLAHGRVVVGFIAVAALGGVLVDARGRVPGPRRQVNEDWLATYRGWVYGAGFGGQLGLAFVTIVAGSVTWIAFVCALGAGSMAAGLAVGATFGLVRALPVLMMARTFTPHALRVRVARLERARPRFTRALTVGQLLVAAGLLAVVVGSMA